MRFDTREGIALDDAHLVGQVLLVAAQHVVDDRLRALVALDALAGEHLHVDDGADMPEGTRSEVSFTSEAFSPKIARSSFSSGVSWVSPLGVTLPTSTSPASTSAPMYTMPDSSRRPSCDSPRFAMSRVISSGPSLVSRATTVSSSMWIEVKRSSATTRSEIRIESSKL
jgi:hypothetical protein